MIRTIYANDICRFVSASFPSGTNIMKCSCNSLFIELTFYSSSELEDSKILATLKRLQSLGIIVEAPKEYNWVQNQVVTLFLLHNFNIA